MPIFAWYGPTDSRLAAFAGPCPAVPDRHFPEVDRFPSCTVDGVHERPPRLTDEEYLRKVEELANAVCDEAVEEGWLTYLPEDSDQSPLQRAINELARNLRHVHHEGDGCFDEGADAG